MSAIIAITLIIFFIWWSGTTSQENKKIDPQPQDREEPKPNSVIELPTPRSPRELKPNNVVAPLVTPPREESKVEREKKLDWPRIEILLREKSIRKVYHFTDEGNLESILRHGGLFSWYYCDRNGIEITFPGGDQLSRKLDQGKGLQDFVRLSFTRDHPMLYIAKKEGRIIRPVLLEIDLAVLSFKETLFSDINAAAGAAIIGDKFDDLERVDFHLFEKPIRYFDLC
ncbi:MAG TPA: DarT ssDNA thymidine ADP-ribosyltransferase family protein, partial [Chroococcales cyanobacterium]